jgi:beta-lactamase superfamily II metal-dependent hydrolase
MNYHGFEVFFLCLGNADCIFVRHYLNGVKTAVLIDGGSKGHTSVVRNFLRSLGENRINHLVCSHHHEDHAAGLIDLVQDTTLKFDQTWVHSGQLAVDGIDQNRFRIYENLMRRIMESKKIQVDLLAALRAQRIPIREPFAPDRIGPLYLVSPTREFYNAQLGLIHQDAIANALNDRYKTRDLRRLMEAVFGRAPETEDEEGELGGEPTSPENEVSTVLVLPWTDANGKAQYFLLTADSGTVALAELKEGSKKLNDILKNLDWMQIPHHGSRRNLNADLIEYFSPKIGYASAEGSIKHPSRKLVNAIKERGGKVYSTHYPPPKNEGAWVRQSCGTVPQLNTTPLPPLWDASS